MEKSIRIQKCVILTLAMTAAACAGADGLPTKSQCATYLKQYDALVTEMDKEIGCPLPPGKPVILTPIEPGKTDPSNPGCKNTESRDQWIASHPQFTTLQNELAECRPIVCPPIPKIEPLSRDLDGDGIPDSEEKTLIDRFAPYVRFTLGENRRPIEFEEFVTKSDLVTPHHWTSGNDAVIIPNSQLVTNPLLVESIPGALGTSLLDSFGPGPGYEGCVTNAPLAYAIHPFKDDWEGGDPWVNDSNTHLAGMVAHVSPFVPNSLSDLPGEHLAAGPGGVVATGETCALQKGFCDPIVNPSGCSPIIPPSHYVTTCKHCIKIEYYQFFGLNDDEKAGVANHEGDLSIVTVIYDPDQAAGPGSGPGAAVSVSHWVHGIEIRYDLLDPKSSCVLKSPERFCTGVNSSHQNLELLGGQSPSDEKLGDIALAQNNTVIFHADLDNPSQQNPEHPEVFVERGSHEFWPTANWSAELAPNHTGNDTAHTYLPKNIPNLGEIEHPNGELGTLVVNYLGLWGATADSENNSSPGPTLHTSWNWFLHAPRVPISCRAAED
jgi:hypothetical protein